MGIRMVESVAAPGLAQLGILDSMLQPALGFGSAVLAVGFQSLIYDA
jgi:hypothetical protein